MPPRLPVPSFTFEAIGHVRSPFTEKLEAPRQSRAKGADVEGTIELLPGRHLEDALADIDTWDHLWVLYAFDRAEGWRPKVQPPRSGKRRGVLATRSPHRPNPIGLSVVRLLGVDGLVLRVRGLDILDGTPVLDLKPYVPYADAVPGAGSGWLAEEADPEPPWSVAWSDDARAQSDWLRDRHAIDLVTPVEQILALGPQKHAYRRIREDARGLRLAYKEWRLRLAVDGRRVVVRRIETGYRPRELALSDEPAAFVHRAFVERFG